MCIWPQRQTITIMKLSTTTKITNNFTKTIKSNSPENKKEELSDNSDEKTDR